MRNKKQKKQKLSSFDALVQGIYANKELKYKVSGTIILIMTCFMIYHTAMSWYELATDYTERINQ